MNSDFRRLEISLWLHRRTKSKQGPKFPFQSWNVTVINVQLWVSCITELCTLLRAWKVFLFNVQYKSRFKLKGRVLRKGMRSKYFHMYFENAKPGREGCLGINTMFHQTVRSVFMKPLWIQLQKHLGYSMATKNLRESTTLKVISVPSNNMCNAFFCCYILGSLILENK